MPQARPPRNRWRQRAVAVALLAAAGSSGATVVLLPQYADTTATARGADAAFYQIDNAWKGSTVLWYEDPVNPANSHFGEGSPISSYAWGTGLWGRPDWQAVQTSAATGNGPPIVNAWTGSGSVINYGNTRYNECYAQTWGPADPVPFFRGNPSTGSPCSDPDGSDPAEQNWTARFAGYIRITDPGLYNFSVLNDDGFFFNLVGQGGAQIGIDRDFLNPRDRNGFGDNLLLSAGLYGFELGMWNRLGAGVVDLRWTRGNGNWDLVPLENLVPDSAIPEPAPLALLLGSLALVGGLRRSRRV